MKLTPEQQDQVERARAAGEKRVTIDFTSPQRAAWDATVQQELAAKQETLELFRKIQCAADQPGFFGDIRRAIIHARRPIEELATEVGIDGQLLSDFRAGDAELPSAVLEQLIQVLGLRLMQEIPRRADSADRQ
jgi:ribosome-binding protein aMBF1 (putative translation factor)